MTTAEPVMGATDRVRAGNLRAYGDLFTENIGRAPGYAFQFTRCPADADDIVADAFERVLGMLRRGIGPDDDGFSIYLRHTIRSVVVDRLRKRAAEKLTEVPELPDTGASDAVDDWVTAHTANRREERLVRAFNRLSPRHRLVLMMTAIDGVPPATVAMALGKTPGQVSALAYRARETLRRLYESDSNTGHGDPSVARQRQRRPVAAPAVIAS